MTSVFCGPSNSTIPIYAVESSVFDEWMVHQPLHIKKWAAATAFIPSNGNLLLVPNSTNMLDSVVLGLEGCDSIWALGDLSFRLPPGRYRLEETGEQQDFATLSALAWGLGAYRYSRYKSQAKPGALLQWPDRCDRVYVRQALEAATFTRDLINTPANDMLPDHLEEAARELANVHGATVQVIKGQRLEHRYPMIHAVGKASEVAPRLIDITWGKESATKITLVGKGVCFDSGGLNLKSRPDMALMKKDMAGAAIVLGLAKMIMMAKLPIRLRVLIPAVENSVSSRAYRPGDILRSRAGLTVEVGNTDAEGRLILADVLADAASQMPSLLIDCATLTGASATALGADLPAYFTEDDELAEMLQSAAEVARDPLWRLPFWGQYELLLDSKIADLNNHPSSPFGGAISAALFLRRFVKSLLPASARLPWIHLDLYAWNSRHRPGRPEGGEASSQRALFELVRKVTQRHHNNPIKVAVR